MADRVDVLRPKPEALPIDLDCITDDLRKRAKIELLEDEDTIVRSLEKLRTLLAKEKDLRWQDDDLFLLSFLRAKKYDVERAFGLVKGLYNCFGKHGHIYYTMNLDFLRRFTEVNCQYVLPYRDAEGSAVYCIRYSTWEPADFNLEEAFVCLSLGLIQALTSPSTQIAGFRFVIDFKGLSVKHLTHSKPSDFLFVAEIFQKSFPARVRGVHLVNQSTPVYYFYSIIKHFFSKKLRERIHFHGSDMKSLHQFIQPSILPADLGGELPEFDNKDWRQRMEASGSYLERVLSYGYEKYLKKDWRTGKS